MRVTSTEVVGKPYIWGRGSIGSGLRSGVGTSLQSAATLRTRGILVRTWRKSPSNQDTRQAATGPAQWVVEKTREKKNKEKKKIKTELMPEM